VVDTGGKFAAVSTTLAVLAVMCIHVLFSIKVERLIVMYMPSPLGFNHWNWCINIWNFMEQNTDIFYQPPSQRKLTLRFPLKKLIE
jgi:hypothetical protein